MSQMNFEQQQIRLENINGDLLLNTADSLLNAIKIVHSCSSHLINLLRTEEMQAIYEDVDLIPLLSELSSLHEHVCPKNDCINEIITFTAAMQVLAEGQEN